MKVEDIIGICLRSESLKRLTRTGWILAGIRPDSGESVAAHSFGTGIVSLLIGEHLRDEGRDINIGKLLTVPKIHDLPEAVISDIPKPVMKHFGKSHCNPKREAENSAMNMILEQMSTKSKLLSISWDEFQKSKTIEAKIVLAADIIDMLIHAISLEQNGVSPDILHDFFNTSQKRIRDINLSIVTEIYDWLYSKHINNSRRKELNQ